MSASFVSGKPASGGNEGTARRLLDAAEEALGEVGYHGASLREIAGRASANLSAVSYHFGGKQGLVNAVFERRLPGLVEDRRGRLAAVQRGEAESGAPPAAEALILAWVEPAVRLRREHPVFARLLTRVLSGEPAVNGGDDSAALPSQREYDRNARDFERALMRGLEVDREDARFLLSVLSAAALSAPTGGGGRADRSFLARIVRLGAAGVHAAGVRSDAR